MNDNIQARLLNKIENFKKFLVIEEYNELFKTVGEMYIDAISDLCMI